MIPGAPLFLYLLPLAAAPIVFHMLMRRRRRRILFSTKMFFDRVHPRLAFHRKLRDILLLAARVVLIAVLLCALARLVLTGMGGAMGLRGRQVAIVILDNSASMLGQVKGSEKTKLQTAIGGARALLTNMEKGAKAGIVLLAPDPRVGQWGGITSERQLMLDFLDKVQVTAATGNAAAAMEQAMAMLGETSAGGGGAIHVFTDLQENEWKGRQIKSDAVADNVRVFFHRVPTAPAALPNVCLMRVRTAARRILPRQPYHIEVLLRNDGDKELQVRVNTQDRSRTTADTETISIAGGEKKEVRVRFRAESPGHHWIRVWIEGDGFAGDNRASISYICEPTGNICFVGEQTAADFGVLPWAFSPTGDGLYTSLVPIFCKLNEVKARIEQQNPVLVVLKWSDACALPAETAALLETYTRQGGNLLVLPAAAAADKQAGQPPAWLGADVEELSVLETPEAAAVSNGRSEFWSDLRDFEGRVRFDGVYVSRYYPLLLGTDAGYEPLVQVGDKGTALAIRGLGEGQIIVSGLAFDGRRKGVPEWSTLPRKKIFLVMAQPMALGAVSGLVNRNASLVAGNAPRSFPSSEDDVRITTLVGDQVDWSGPRDQAPTLVREGAYIVSMGRRDMCLSVMPSDTEGGTAFLADAKIAAMGAAPHEVRDLSDAEDFRDALERSVAGMELYTPLLLLALLALMTEGILGSASLRRKGIAADAEEAE